MTSGIDPLLFWIFAGPTLFYVCVHLFLSIGILRIPKRTHPYEGRISVVVAARNEEATIEDLLTALSRQTRLPDEAIIVDDRSEDSTSRIVLAFVRLHPWTKYLKVDNVPTGLTPKRNAILSGINATSGDLICLTDADCVPPPRWLEFLSGLAGPDTSMVVGTYTPRLRTRASGHSIMSTLLYKFVVYEKFRSTILAFGSHGLGFPWLANGASMAYKKEAFNAIGGFAGDNRSLSGDDDLLVQRMHKSRPGSVACLAEPAALVETYAPPSFNAFFRQRLRHFSAGKYYRPSVQTFLTLYHLANGLSVLSLICAIILSEPRLITAYALKTCADLVLLAAGDLRLKRPREWSAFLPLEILYVFYVSVFGPLGMITKVQWKAPRTA